MIPLVLQKPAGFNATDDLSRLSISPLEADETHETSDARVAGADDTPDTSSECGPTTVRLPAKLKGCRKLSESTCRLADFVLRPRFISGEQGQRKQGKTKTPGRRKKRAPRTTNNSCGYRDQPGWCISNLKGEAKKKFPIHSTAGVRKLVSSQQFVSQKVHQGPKWAGYSSIRVTRRGKKYIWLNVNKIKSLQLISL